MQFLITIRVFSSFIAKEKNSASNIKDRKNRHNVCKILGSIETRIQQINDMNTKGLFIFAGLDEFGSNIFDIIEPTSCSKMFYYSCGSKFDVDICTKYFRNYDGYIVFVSGEICLIYNYQNGRFVLNNCIESMIPNKHKKGGQSSVRFGRIADNIREKYVITIAENINKISSNGQVWLFGSNDVIDNLFNLNTQQKLLIGSTNNVKRGHHIEFDRTTILTTEYWLQFLKIDENNDEIYQTMIECLQKYPNLVCFDQTFFEHFEFIIVNPLHADYNQISNIASHKKVIKLNPNSKYYNELKGFHLIGKLYYEMSHNDMINDESV